jgi:hypothetical protein
VFHSPSPDVWFWLPPSISFNGSGLLNVARTRRPTAKRRHHEGVIESTTLARLRPHRCQSLWIPRRINPKSQKKTSVNKVPLIKPQATGSSPSPRHPGSPSFSSSSSSPSDPSGDGDDDDASGPDTGAVAPVALVTTDCRPLIHFYLQASH